jgi:hypothetical protein
MHEITNSSFSFEKFVERVRSMIHRLTLLICVIKCTKIDAELKTESET